MGCQRLGSSSAAHLPLVSCINAHIDDYFQADSARTVAMTKDALAGFTQRGHRESTSIRNEDFARSSLHGKGSRPRNGSRNVDDALGHLLEVIC